MKTLKLAVAASLASLLAAGAAHATPPTDWSALKINRPAAKTVKADADRAETSTEQRRSENEDTVKKMRKAPAMTWRFGGPNRY